jgi:two-component system sensor histidine kinase KdpD
MEKAAPMPLPPDFDSRARVNEECTMHEQAPAPTSLAIDEGVSEAASTESDVTEVMETAGRFRVYLGAAPGVGKTFAMLSEGQRRREDGIDVVVGYAECHGRPPTEELLDGLEIVPYREVAYRGMRIQEMDLDAVLRRKPRLALVDELAHTIVPDTGKYKKRWQEVLELLEAGINVITTVNIQHLESIADAVEQLTGAPVHERVPDSVVRRADQIELVDSSPEELRRRLLDGKIYSPQMVPQALNHFFRSENLIALRELAFRFLADEPEEELLEFLSRQQSGAALEPSERIMVAVTGAPGTEAVLRRAARIAARFQAELHVVHVVRDNGAARSDDDSLEALRPVATEVGGRWVELRGDDVAQTIIEFARDTRITQVVLGSGQRSRWWKMLRGGSTAQRVQRMAVAAGIDVHIIVRREVPLEVSGIATGGEGVR